ncbi:Lin1244/Lin1753 domain-containing protein [Ezakiella peruensis]|uniref:Lin1244/Lin1753 domain-containing protein n=1 Tax=Ezakiella peruensis TaxID=1464038 RepID=UPI000C1B0C69|nr:Lin1244/Lin1753 domain-containing protein [Ezakiella peruensis]
MEKNIQGYFSHDSNARNDTKILNLRAKLGAEGYGIYFMLLERLREDSDYMSVTDYNAIAFDLRVDAGKVKSVVEDFGLFAFTEDGACFYSESFRRRMSLKDNKANEISEKRRKAANKRWQGEKEKQENIENQGQECKSNASAMQMHAKNMQNDAKKRKEKKSKENKSKTYTHRDIIMQKINEYTQSKELIDCLCMFVDLRFKRNKPFDEASFELFLKQLDTMSKGKDEDKIIMLRNALMNGWENIYPLKASDKAKMGSFDYSDKRQTDGMSDEELDELLRYKGD